MIPLDNQIIRKEKILLCKQMPSQQRKAYSQRITKQCQAFIDHRQCIGIYLPLPYEVDISALVQQAKGRMRFAVPKVLSAEAMEFVLLDDHTKLTSGAFHIKEPKEGLVVDPAEFDVIFIPLVAFSKACDRLGHGKGYYDRYLQKTRALKIAVAFECQRCDRIITCDHDIRMDIVITEQGVYRRSQENE